MTLYPELFKFLVKKWHRYLINASPFMELKVLCQLNLPIEKQLSLRDENEDLESARKLWELIPAGHRIGTPEPIFKELVCTSF